MARGIVSQDVTVQGQRHVQVTRMDGQPVDEDEWKVELKVPDADVSRLVTAGWPDESIPGTYHRQFTWWENPPLPNPSPSGKAPDGEGL